MQNSQKFKKLKIFIFFTFYLSLLFGFFINEDLNFGARMDWNGYKSIIIAFKENFKNTFFEYPSFHNRHSPVIHILFSFLLKAGFSLDGIRILNLHIILLIIIFFYKILKLRFKSINKNYLFLIALFIPLSSTFRSLSIWPDSRIYGVLFFSISLYYFLKFLKDPKNYFAFYNIFFLAISSYFSPNFSIFSVYFFWRFYNHYKFSKNLFRCFVLNITLAIPAIYYLFVLKLNFLFAGVTPGSSSELNLNAPELNFWNKFLIITSIIFFYLIPLIISKGINYYSNFNKKLCFPLILIFWLLCVNNFTYQNHFTGGGIFFKTSNILFGNNLFFYIISFFALYYVLVKIFTINNFLLIFLLIISNIQLTIYHKYYDPLILILIFSLFEIRFKKNYFNLKNILFIYLINLLLIIANLIKINFY